MSQPVATPPRPSIGEDQIVKIIVFVLIIALGLAGLYVARRAIDPLDHLLTDQACSQHGREELSRQVVDVEPSNRFALTNRTQGSCTFGPVVLFDDDGNVVDPPEDEASDDIDSESDTSAATDGDAVSGEVEAEPGADGEQVVVAIPEIETGSFYRGMKWLFLIVQLGVGSGVARLVADPLLDRFVRR